MHNMPIRNLNQGVTANNCTSILKKALSHTSSWLDPTGICNLSLLTCSMCFTWSDLHSFLQHEINILHIQYKVPDNLALLPVVTDVITGSIFSMNTEADVYLLATLFPTM